MATSLEQSEKEAQISNTISYLPQGENLVKIDLVDRDIICLKRSLKINKN